MLSSTSHVRVQVEQTRSDVIRWLRRRWINVRQEGGFEGMQEWALKELAQGKRIFVSIVIRFTNVFQQKLGQTKRICWHLLQQLPKARLPEDLLVLRRPTIMILRVCIHYGRRS